MIPEAYEACIFCFFSQLVTEFRYRLFNNNMTFGVSPLTEPVEEIILEHGTFPSTPHITTKVLS